MLLLVGCLLGASVKNNPPSGATIDDFVSNFLP
jgi:hypothetical protein